LISLREIRIWSLSGTGLRASNSYSTSLHPRINGYQLKVGPGYLGKRKCQGGRGEREGGRGAVMERHPMPEVMIKSISNLVLSASTDKPLDYFDPLNIYRRFLNLKKVYDTRV